MVGGLNSVYWRVGCAADIPIEKEREEVGPWPVPVEKGQGRSLR